jgi:hypothetical protein
MVAPNSPHIPEVAGEIVAVTGTLLVDTGLREIQTFSATLAQTSIAGAASVSVLPQAVSDGGHQKLLLQVWAADGATPSAVAANVAWLALGK